jgi:hypothetical protein
MRATFFTEKKLALVLMLLANMNPVATLARTVWRTL